MNTLRRLLLMCFDMIKEWQTAINQNTGVFLQNLSKIKILKIRLQGKAITNKFSTNAKFCL